MPTVLEQIRECEYREQRYRAQALCADPKLRAELFGYMVSLGDIELARQIFGEAVQITLDQIEIQLEIPESIIQIPSSFVYRGEPGLSHELDISAFSQKELSLLLQVFFQSVYERERVIDLVFYKNNFLRKTQTDILDVLQKAEELFRTTDTTRSKVTLTLVSPSQDSPTPELPFEHEAANDSHFTPLIDRIFQLEPRYAEYIHEIYQSRLEFAESIFCQMVMFLAEMPENQAWAMDPLHMQFYVTPVIQEKIELLKSICEFHGCIDTHYPQLHQYIEDTVLAWIFAYKGFCAPKEMLRLRQKKNSTDIRNTR